jgi:predicted Zn-dependent peptidase
VLHVGALYALAQRWIPSADAAEIASQSATAASTESLAQQLDRRVVDFTLPNGMRFLCAERRTAPIVSFYTYADVGAFDEPEGLTGIAHLLEHMAFKGTPRIGTVNFQQENELLLAMDEVFYSLISAGNSREAAALQRQLDSLLAAASELQVPNAYGALLQREGAVGLNAATTHDSTTYVCSLPSNKLELWFALEAERFQLPVFRELYSEKKVVFEERRMRVENAPLGRFQERFAAVSLTNNYRRPVIGFPEDLERMGRREVAQFFAEQYGPEKLTVAVVGDASPERVRQLAEKYFGGWKSSSSRAHSARSGSGINPGQESLPRPEGPATDRELVYQSRAGPAVLRAWCVG